MKIVEILKLANFEISKQQRMNRSIISGAVKLRSTELMISCRIIHRGKVRKNIIGIQ